MTVLHQVALRREPHALQGPRPAHAAAVAPAAGREAPLPDAEALARAVAQARASGEAAGRAACQAANEQAVRAAHEAARQQGLEEGRLLGLQQGREAGRREAEAAMRQRLQRLDGLLQTLQAQAADWRSAAEDDMAALCHETVCRMLGVCAATPQAVLAMVQALQPALGAPLLAVHLHPHDHAAVIGAREYGADGGWAWVADPTVQLGGVVLRSATASLDARLETQLQVLRETLLAARAAAMLPAGPMEEAA